MLTYSQIAEVRNYFSTHKREVDAAYTRVKKTQPESSSNPVLLLGGVPKATESEIRSALPPRPQIESLVNRVFVILEMDVACKIIHPPTFREQLAAYFKDPMSQPIAWIALLYSALTIAMQSYGKHDDEPSEWVGRTKDMAIEYRRRTVQALVTANYVAVRQHILEALLLYSVSEFITSMDISVGQWLVLGNITRLAIRAGYHRDGAQFKEMTPFAVEMRRRVWLFIRSCDVLFSVSLALPHMINARDCDTRLPLNIQDHQFGPDSASLPKPEPDDVNTPMTYFLLKGRLSILLGQIIDETQGLSGRSVTYSTVLTLDSQIRKIMENVPSEIVVRSIEDCQNDSTEIILQRFYMDIMAAKLICVLHRRYVGLAHKDSRYSLSRTRAVTAAMRLLELQTTIYRECRPGGRLPGIHWGLSGMHGADFLLGAMILCLDLNTAESHGHPFVSASPPVIGKDGKNIEREEMIGLLESNLHIWEERAEVSMEAFKAKEIIKVMLGLVKREDVKPEPKPSYTQGWIDSNQPNNGFGVEAQGEEHAAAQTLGMLSAGLSPNTAAFFQNQNLSIGTGLTPGPSGAQAQFSMSDGTYPGVPRSQDTEFGGMFASGGDVGSELDWVSVGRWQKMERS